MKVLWITNILFPEATARLYNNKEFKTSGGWMLGAAESLISNHNIQLAVASVSKDVKELTTFVGEKITHFIIPYGKGNLRINKDYIPYWKHIRQVFNPDLVHIHGTEFTHGQAYLLAHGNENVVISIQGLKSAYRYYHYGMSNLDIIANLTLRDILRGSIWQQKNSFKKSGEIEKSMIKTVKHVIGRTSWDRSRVWAINPSAKYHFCNEVLRTEFYTGEEWNLDTCCRYSIFLSQSSYPLKGLHQVLKAMPLILRHFPDTTIRIAGNDIITRNTFRRWLRYSGYGKYIKHLILKYNLKDKVCFVGNLNAEQMKQEYLRANVFICPSSVENSPNSLGEAQLLGVPCIASYVGGIPDMMKENDENLYRYEEVEMLAYKVCNIFTQVEVNRNMKQIAFNRHNSQTNTNQLYTIYKSIIRK